VAWTSVLSLLDNNATTLIMALLVFAVALVIKPRAYVYFQILVIVLQVLVSVFVLGYSFSVLLNLINTVFRSALAT
jgi:hypothetical protein